MEQIYIIIIIIFIAIIIFALGLHRLYDYIIEYEESGKSSTFSNQTNNIVKNQENNLNEF